MQSNSGYYRYPSIFEDVIVFVSDDDIWRVSKNGGRAERLTNNIGLVSHAIISPDGKQIAFSSEEEGHIEVYTMSINGGPVKRITYLGDTSYVVNWDKTGDNIIFNSGHKQPFSRLHTLYKVPASGGIPVEFNTGPSSFIDYANDGKKNVIQRRGYREYAYWKRYRGGTAGQAWIDKNGNGEYTQLIDLKSDIARPIWIGDRIYFISDHDGIGNIYSTNIDGKDLRTETNHKDYYIRNISTSDDKSITYHAGGDIFVYDVESRKTNKIDIDFYSQRFQRSRKFINAIDYLQDYDLHPNGSHIAMTSRGRPLIFDNFDGPISELRKEKSGRSRQITWLYDGKEVVQVNDESGEESLEIYDAQSLEFIKNIKLPKRKDGESEIGRVISIKASPTRKEVVLTNHRNEIIFVDLDKSKAKLIDRSDFSVITGFDISPDGNWVTYDCSKSRHVTCIKLYNIKDGKTYEVTKPVLRDESPSFSKDGKYLYFNSFRSFDPSWDTMHFDLSFQSGSKPCALVLKAGDPSPFFVEPKSLVMDKKEETGDDSDNEKSAKNKDKDKKKAEEEIKEIEVDLNGIEKRIVEFPIKSGVYDLVKGIKGKAFFIDWQFAIDSEEERTKGGALRYYDIEKQKVSTYASNVLSYFISNDGMHLTYVDGDFNIRVAKTEEPLDNNDDSSLKQQGWIDYQRIKVEIEPEIEWPQIYNEAWRLQRDNFWNKDMSNIDWKAVQGKYEKLVPRVSTREELSDVIWEMQGELGTSHAYVMGGDTLRTWRNYVIGKLGIDVEFDKKHNAYKITKICNGDVWDKSLTSSFNRPDLDVKEGDIILEVNNEKPSINSSLGEHLLNQAGQEIRLKIADKHGKNEKYIFVKSLRSELGIRYREWVEANRKYIHEKTNGKIGYIHVPDMSSMGYAEFHRGFLPECDKEGLIVDVRYNGGGNVSCLLLEKLNRQRLGFDLTRWMGVEPYPADSPSGPMVALTNEFAGSDGDIFSHSFKLMGLGPLIGQRTWGGVVGIWPRHSLVDKGATTQPEFSFWFKDVGWGIENYGVDPDIDVDKTPSDFIKGHDPQLDRAIAEVKEQIKKNPPLKPNFGELPKLA